MKTYIILFLLSASAAFSQTYPEYHSTTVNDQADLLSASDEAVLSEQLSTLRRDTGVEMTVLTLATQSDYAPDQTMEQFATGLFNHWGIGDADRNDGVLVLILSDDRAMRIELGASYARDWDAAAVQVIDDHFLGAFSDGDYPRGILEGSAAVRDEIVLPFLAGQDAPERTGSTQNWPFIALIAMVMLFNVRRYIGDGLVRLRKCPSCGHRSLRQTRRTTMAASRTASGSGIRNVSCSRCMHSRDYAYVIPRVSSGSSGGFGGGRSGGGGGSGRW